MRLRNKKTGKVVEAYKEEPIDLFIYLSTDEEGDELDRKTYRSITELNEEWEDYKPAEPLIKDEKVRKAVRAWAEANEYDFDNRLDYTEYVGGYGCSFMTYDSDDNEIHFCKKLGLEDGKDYTIAELCGEEEEE